MVKYLLDRHGQLRVEQWTVAPAVYFDHWALRDISEDSTLRHRFMEALLRRGGTLMLSWLNLVEFTKVTDASQARAAEALVEDLLPNVFFFEVNPFAVIEAEDALLAGADPFPPHADTQFLSAFSALRPNSPRPFTARNLFTIPQESGLHPRMDGLADTVVERVEALRSTFLSDAEFESRVRKLPQGQPIQHGTRYVLRELVRPVLLDQSLKFSRNHAIDLMHSVVPLAYCDIVLLDKHWKTQAEKVRERVAAANMTFPVAKVFSGKTDEVSKFLELLESDVQHPHAPDRLQRASPASAGR
jgi:hypothetical protein